MMIGIFDSGIGGLTVASAFMEKLPGYDIIYFGDTARTPYGTKSPATVISYSLQNTEFLIRQGAKIIIIACNTASSIATEAIAQNFDIPLFEKTQLPCLQKHLPSMETCYLKYLYCRLHHPSSYFYS